MKILILGADGMLGFQAVQYFQNRHEVIGTVRKRSEELAAFPEFQKINCHYQVVANNFSRIQEIFEFTKPDAILNCIGIVKQRAQAYDVIESIEINALFPHRLAALCLGSGTRLIHYSTDCIFTGNKGNYEEQDLPDAVDLYGRSKLMGEVNYLHTVTLRTSIIGLELFHKKSLIEWFLAQSGAIKGFKYAKYTGFTTLEMCRISELVLKNRSLHGIYQVASEPIAKFDLLKGVNEAIGGQVSIHEDEDFQCDRSLKGSRFNKDARYTPPSWNAMIAELAEQIRGRQ